jgi:multiple sugar transport system substrate-binding protein
MFVNKTLLEREGIPMPSQDWNWQDFYEICAKVTKDTDGDGVLDQFGMYEYNWQLAVATNGGGLFSPEGKSCYFADGRVEQSVNFVMRLKKLQQGHEVTSREVDLGRVAFRPFTFAQYKTYKPYPWRIKKFSDSEWDCVRLPAGPAGENVSPVRTLLIAMSNRTAEPGLAWQFIKKISMDPEVQMLLMEKSQGLSVRRDVVLKAAWNERGRADSESIDLQAVSQVMEGAISPPKFRDYKAAIILAENAIQDIYAGKVPLSNGLHKLQKEVNAYLQR